MEESLRDRLSKISPEYQAFLDICPPGEPFVGETLRADGWTYKDLPQLTKAQFDTFIAVVGKKHIRWLATAERTTNETTTYRGQGFISPEGKARLEAYLNKAV